MDAIEQVRAMLQAKADEFSAEIKANNLARKELNDRRSVLVNNHTDVIKALTALKDLSKVLIVWEGTTAEGLLTLPVGTAVLVQWDSSSEWWPYTRVKNGMYSTDSHNTHSLTSAEAYGNFIGGPIKFKYRMP